MKKLLMLTTAAGIAFALASPTLAATRTHRALDAYASSVDQSGPYNYGPVRGGQGYNYAPAIGSGGYGSQALTPSQYSYERGPYGYGQNLPYADRPYGAPDGW